MKRFRIKLVGFGLAALAGSALAADGDWHPVGQPPAPASPVVPAGGEPGVLPASLRVGPRARSELGPAMESLWFPVSDRLSVPAEVLRGSLPDVGSSLWPRTMPLPRPAGPRVGALPGIVDASADVAPPQVTVDDPSLLQPPTPLPPTPLVPIPPVGELPAPRPVNPEPPWKGTNPPPSVPDPSLVPQPPKMPPSDSVPPRVPEMILPDPPRPVSPVTPPPAAAAAGTELPVAPPELMVPKGDPVPGKHGTFGSPPIRISRDYPALSDLCDTPRLKALGKNGAADKDAAILERGFVEGEFLLWWAKGLSIPVLATTSTNGGNGFLGQSGTVPILGPGNFVDPFRQGFRVRAGMWFDDCGTCGIDGSFFYLGRKSADALLTSDVFPIITRPIYSPNVRNGTIIGESGEAVTVPGILTGSLSAHAESLMYGFDANFRRSCINTCDTRASWFVGYRNLNLQESLSVTENINVVGAGGTRVPFGDPVGSVVMVQDRFATENHFNGAQLGGTYERRWGRVSLDARASVALGVTHQDLDIDGYQIRTQPGLPPMTFRGGLLAAGPNLGSFDRNKFSVAPEATLNLGYWVTPTLKVHTGFNFLYWSNVIRPGDQIDRVVDLTFVPNSLPVAPSGQLRPQPLFSQSGMWVTGMQFGLEWRW